MAQGFVLSLRPSGAVGQATMSFVATCCFVGDDVDRVVVGRYFEILVTLVSAYSLEDLKTAVVQAVTDKATELGLTVDASNIDIPSYESG